MNNNKKLFLFCSGLSGSGKSYFIKNILPKDMFYNLKSATTRPMREGEQDGVDYYFKDESYFDTEKLATLLWVNEQFWSKGTPKWLYGVPEFEIYNHLNCNLTYDIIQPKYIKQMLNWFTKNGLDDEYYFKILWFLPPTNNFEIANKRSNMPNDSEVRHTNTCNIEDFNKVGLRPDYNIICNTQQIVIDAGLQQILNNLQKTH